MGLKPVTRRTVADADIEAIVDYYLREADAAVAASFVEALHSAVRLIQRYPSIGSSRYAALVRIPDLRTSTLDRFPYVICYLDQESRIDIVRILHARRDIPAWLAESPAHDGDGQE